MGYGSETLGKIQKPVAYWGGYFSSVLSANGSLSVKDGTYIRLDANGSHRDVTLPAVGITQRGLTMFIANSSSGATNLVLKNAAGGTVATVNQSEEAQVYVNDSGAWALLGIRAYSAT